MEIQACFGLVPSIHRQLLCLSRSWKYSAGRWAKNPSTYFQIDLLVQFVATGSGFLNQMNVFIEGCYPGQLIIHRSSYPNQRSGYSKFQIWQDSCTVLFLD